MTASGRGLGKWLLLDAMARSLASEVAWAAFVVDAKVETARSFYLQYGFMALTDDLLHLFLPRATVQAALRGDRRARQDPAPPCVRFLSQPWPGVGLGRGPAARSDRCQALV